MGSFYDIPRSAPIPTSVNKVPTCPLVPEVSMMFNSGRNGCSGSNTVTDDRGPPSYKEWQITKENFKVRPLLENKENIYDGSSKCGNNSSTVDSQLNRKQVRFESSGQLPQVIHTAGSSHDRPGIQNTCGMSKPFEQIYMANIPNRHLDLSMLNVNNTAQTDIHRKPCAENNPKVLNGIKENCSNTTDPVPKTYKEFLISQKNYKANHTAADKCVTDIYNYKNPKLVPSAEIPQRNKTVDKKISKPDTGNVCTSRNGCSEKTKAFDKLPDEPRYFKHQSFAIQQDKFDINHISKKGSYENTKLSIRNASQVDEGCSAQIANNLKSKVSVETNTSLEPDQPSVKDLLKIIQQQNEQLLILQKQVARLIENQEPQRRVEAKPFQRQIEPPISTTVPTNIFGEKLISSTGHEILNRSDLKKGHLPKFAIDVMTSFEVSIRRQQNFQQRNKYYKEYVTHEPKIQEITETDSNTSRSDVEQKSVGDFKESKTTKDGTTNDDVSLVLNEPLTVREECPSPVNSIHVDMKDYSSDSSEESSSSDVNWSIYNNVMEQVNNILKKAEPNARAGSGISTENAFPEKVNSRTMKKVRAATIKHLKKIGVDLTSIDDGESSSGTPDSSHEYTPAEVSFAVKQVLMKYLPDDHLAKVTYKQDNLTENVKKDNGFVKRHPQFSFATLQYMKKYNLLPDDRAQDIPVHKGIQENIVREGQDCAPKVLDITALKQQPKLL